MSTDTAVRIGLALLLAITQAPHLAIAQAGRERVTPSLAAVAAIQPLGPVPALRPLAPGPRAASALSGARETLAEAVDRCVESDLALTGVPGAAVAVAVDGTLAYSRGYGVKHRHEGGDVTASTSFRIGSLTKMMTAAAVMQQVEAGRVSLDDPVTALIPELAFSGHRGAGLVTVRHLLTHTSAIPDLPFDLDGPRVDSAIADWVLAGPGITLNAQPGAFYNYSNPNYMLAGLIAERAAGLPYHRLMDEAIWAPAGMTATTLDPVRVLARGDYTYGHGRAASGRELILAPDAYDNWLPAPSGYAFSTAPDVARWAIMLMAGGAPVLSRASAAAMQAPQAFESYGPDQYYGFGIAVWSYQGLDVREHDGHIEGWSSDVLWVSDRGFAVVVLDNGATPLYGAAQCVVDAVLAPEGPPPPDLTTDPATWTPYLGSYAMVSTLGDRFRADVALLGDRLMLTLPDLDESGPLTFPMTQFAPDSFAIDSDGDEVPDMDFTFIHGPSAPARWLRNRTFVGERASSPRGRTP